ncbi:MAG TPA: hypothetical protein VLL08_32250 [Kineosporiaceae bacterium]|nr:hypothetical protein [Kineosporiaceae bacterium]
MTETVNVEVQAVREGRWWVLHITGGGTTQARTLTQVEAMVADYVGLNRDVPAGAVRVTITDIDPGAGLGGALAAAREAQADAVRAQEQAAVKVRALAKTLRERGLSGAEIAIVMGVSKQRVSQLTAAATPQVSNAQAALTSKLA